MKYTRLMALLLSSLPLAATCLTQSASVAVIDTEAFGRKAGGIARLVRAQDSVEAELEPHVSELNGLQKQLMRLSSPVTPIPVYPSDEERRRERVDSLKKEIERKQAESDAKYMQRMRDVVGPIMLDVEKHLEVFAKRRGVALLLDKS